MLCTWPYKPHYFDGNGFRMHYVDENPQGKETFLCVHGEPTWGYLYRNIIPPLARLGRVVVPDHMGFGKARRHASADTRLRSTVTIWTTSFSSWA